MTTPAAKPSAPAPMLAIADLKAASAARTRRLLLTVLLAFATALLCFAVGFRFNQDLRQFYSRAFGTEVGQALMGLTPFPAVLVLLVGTWLASRADVRCPRCHQPLGHIRHIVIATGNCGHCGRVILIRPTDEPN